MGCTSSAPNTLPINANTADKSIQFEEETYGNPSIEVDVAGIEDENQTNETKVLPSCDTTEEPVQLARNNKSSNSLDIDKDNPVNGHVIESEDKTGAPINTPEEVKIPKLELLMEKVFETNHHLNEDHKLNDMKNDEKKEENSLMDVTGEAESNKEETDTKTDTESNHNEGDNKGEEGEPEAKEASPSQSQSSRATRWEALADIAAELPPSLAVDPITGQIFQIAQPKRVIVD